MLHLKTDLLFFSTGSFTKLDELINSWRLFFHDCQQKGKNCTVSVIWYFQELSLNLSNCKNIVPEKSPYAIY